MMLNLVELIKKAVLDYYQYLSFMQTHIDTLRNRGIMNDFKQW